MFRNVPRTLVSPIIDIGPHLVAPFDAFLDAAAELLVTHFVADIRAPCLKIDIAIDKLLDHGAYTCVDEVLTEEGEGTLRPVSRWRRFS